VISFHPEEVFAAASTSATTSISTAAPAAAVAPHADVHHEMVFSSVDAETEAAPQSGRAPEIATADMLASQPTFLAAHLVELDRQLILLTACLRSLCRKMWTKTDVQFAETVALGSLERLFLPELMEIVKQNLTCNKPPRLERGKTQGMSAADKAFLQASDNVTSITEHVSVVLLRQHISELLEQLRLDGLTNVSEHLMTVQERSGCHYFVMWLGRMAKTFPSSQLELQLVMAQTTSTSTPG